MSIAPLFVAIFLQAAPPEHPVLEAFKDACIPERSSMAALSQSLERAGWTRAGAADHPELARELAQQRPRSGRSRWEEATGFTARPSRTDWVRGSGSGRLFLTLSVSDQGDFIRDDENYPPSRVEVTSLLSCKVSDFESRARISSDVVSAWVGAQPARFITQDGGFEYGEWDVSGRLLGAMKVTTRHMPTGPGPASSDEATWISIDSTTETRVLPVRSDFDFGDNW